MARKIIVLNKLDSGAGDIHYQFAFWFAVPTARQPFYANASFVSQVVGADAPTAAELTALQNGSVTEQIRDAFWTNGTALATIQTDLANAYNIGQTQVNAYNPWNRYGSTWDGTTWTMKTIA